LVGALTNKHTDTKVTHGKESKHRREAPPRNGKEEKGRGKEGTAPQKEGAIGGAGCAEHALGGKQLTPGIAAPLITEGDMWLHSGENRVVNI
jgi:hypothetical protein